MNLFVQGFGKLSAGDQVRALELFRNIERDQECWDLGRYEGVRKLDLQRIRGAFHSKNPVQARSMLQALAGLERPQSKPYQRAAAKSLA